MAKIEVNIEDELEKEFRNEVLRKYYLTENGTSLAFEEALKDWIEKTKRDYTVK